MIEYFQVVLSGKEKTDREDGNMKKRIAALLLSLAVCLGTLTGCASEKKLGEALGSTAEHILEAAAMQTEEVRPEATAAAAGGYDTSVWRADADYENMVYCHYSLDDLNGYAQSIYDLAAYGGTAEEFSQANNDVIDEVYYIYTLMTLADLEYAQDPTDESALQEYNYTLQLWYDAYDIYWDAMQELSGSRNSELLKNYYADWQIAQFTADYGDDDDTLSLRENELVQDYYAIMAADDPDYDAAVTVFVQLVNVRNEIAAQYGYDSYAYYAYESQYARNYTPADAERIWACAKEYYVPLVAEFGSGAYSAASRLWNSGDIDCSTDAVLAAIGSGASMLSDDVFAAYSYMTEHGLYDIDYSGTKINTGYTTILYYYNEPYIFNAATGGFGDYLDMFHEFGHFVNYFYTTSDLFFGLSDNDLCELQSQGMEMMFTQYYSDIFGGHAADVLSYELMSMVYSVLDGALYDEFLQRVYAEPSLTEQRVLDIYAELYGQYGYEEYTGYEYEWVEVPHNFDYPFYYISYGVSAVSALEIYSLLLDSPELAKDTYLAVSAMDPEAYYFSDALEEAGLSDVFSDSVYELTASAVRTGLGA